MSNTRVVLGWIADAAPSLRILETNMYSVASESKGELLAHQKSTAVIKFLLDAIKPKIVVAHGKDTVDNIGCIVLSGAQIVEAEHFAIGWSELAARRLGERLVGMINAEKTRPRYAQLDR